MYSFSPSVIYTQLEFKVMSYVFNWVKIWTLGWPAKDMITLEVIIRKLLLCKLRSVFGILILLKVDILRIAFIVL